MVMLKNIDIATTEVLSWAGLHLFHHPVSTCSQKTRIFLRLKGIDWTPHEVNLLRKEQLTPYYMGINPRGLIPTLVHDGKVVIESNDILEYLEAEFPDPPLIPAAYADRVATLLKEEDDLHLDIRALTMRFVLPTLAVKRAEADIARYESSGSGTVEGKVDLNRKREAGFWRDMNTHNGIPDDQVIRAFRRFKGALDHHDRELVDRRYLLGDDASVLDIAWYIYARRLLAAGYPIAQLHPSVGTWFERLDADPVFRDEVPTGGLPGTLTLLLHGVQRLTRTALVDVVRRC